MPCHGSEKSCGWIPWLKGWAAPSVIGICYWKLKLMLLYIRFLYFGSLSPPLSLSGNSITQTAPNPSLSLSYSWRWDQWTLLILHIPASSSRQCSSSTTAWDLDRSRAVQPSNANCSWRYTVRVKNVYIMFFFRIGDGGGSLIEPQLNTTMTKNVFTCYYSVKTVMTILSNTYSYIFVFKSVLPLFRGLNSIERNVERSQISISTPSDRVTIQFFCRHGR